MRFVVRILDSQAYSKMNVTRELLLSFQTGFNLLIVAVVCAVLESISGFEPSSNTTESRHLKLVTEVFDDSNKVGADVRLRGCPQSCMLNPVEGLLEVYEDMVEVLLVLS